MVRFLDPEIVEKVDKSFMKYVFKHWVTMSSKRRGIVKEFQVELSVSDSVSESVNLWSIEVLTDLKTKHPMGRKMKK